MTRVVAYGTPEERAAAAETVAGHLERGGVLAYPTETVYGLGCTLHDAGLRALTSFKGDRPFLLLIRGPGDAPGLRWTVDARRLADTFWPGPLTLALTANAGRYPEAVVGPDGAVAVRVSPHPGVAAILEAAQGPITSTSANRAGDPPARDAVAARAVGPAFPELLVLDGGRLPREEPSTIVRCGTTSRLIREGPISRRDLEAVVELERGRE